MHENDFDPASLNDPVALKTEWSPRSWGGSSIRTHALSTHLDRAVFKPTVWRWLIAVPFVLVGVLQPLIPLQVGDDWIRDLMVFVLFTPLGLVFLYSLLRPVVFDRNAHVFWEGYGERQAGQKGVVALKGLHALQIITEFCVSRNSKSRRSYYSYELNLVFNDGRRVNVVDHGNLQALRADAKKLSEFLGVPLWDPR